MGRAESDCRSGRSYFKTSPKRWPKGLGGGCLRHRGRDLHRYLIAPDLQAYRTNGGMVSRTRSVLQILHTPPSLPYVVVVGNKLRPHLRDVKQDPQHLVVSLHKQHYISRNYRFYSNLTDHFRLGPAVPFPPVFRRLSASSRQAFHRLLHRLQHALSRENPRLSHKFYAHFSYEKSAIKARAFSSAYSCEFRRAEAD